MKKKYFLFLIVLAIISYSFLQCSSGITNPVVRELTPLEKQLVSSSSEFGFNLFKKINKVEAQNNIFISPLSVSMALGMALNGASGTTYDAMKSTLEFSSLTKQQINETYQSLIGLLTKSDPKVTFNIANSIWYKNTFNFKKEFIDVNKKYFNAEVESLDFTNNNSVNIINNWVNEKTNGKISKIVEKIPQNIIMYLINAIYFKGTWKYEFNKKSTQQDIFNDINGNQITCNMMAQKNKFLYYSNSDLQIIDLPYGNENFSMVVILPVWGKNVNEVIEQLDKNTWNNYLSNLKKEEGTIQLPKFKLENKYLLNKVLKQLGMEIAFDKGKADFTNMNKSGGIYIDEVLHKTFVQVDEEGTEATAVTSVSFGVTSAGGNGFLMRVDRPFVFIIKEKNSNSILFMGKVIKPE